jgi:hypothetical protein
MFQYVYVSSAVKAMSDRELADLLEVSRRKNLEADLTGLLLYLHGGFIQLLEGEKDDVLATVARIDQDPRHRGIIVLLEAECKKRDFADWSMGFQKLEGPETARMPGYSDFLAQPSDPGTQRSGALRLLEFFKEINT